MSAYPEKTKIRSRIASGLSRLGRGRDLIEALFGFISDNLQDECRGQSDELWKWLSFGRLSVLANTEFGVESPQDNFSINEKPAGAVSLRTAMAQWRRSM